MAKRLFFAAMTCCMLICSVAFVACSDDDDSGSGTSGGGEVTTAEYQDGVEGVEYYFYNTDADGNKKLVRGIVLDKSHTDELTIVVKNETMAYSQFAAMLVTVDSTCIIENIDGSITANLTDTLGNVKGKAEFTLINEGGVIATVTFTEGLIEGVSKVDFVTESALQADNGIEELLNELRKRQIHHYGDVIKVQAPKVRLDAEWLTYLSEETKEVDMICVTYPDVCWPAYYVYFDNDKFLMWNSMGGLDATGEKANVVRYIPTSKEVRSFVTELELEATSSSKAWWNNGGKVTKAQAVANFAPIKAVMTEKGHYVDNQCYWTRTPCNYSYYYAKFSSTDGYTCLPANKNVILPYLIIKRLKYDEAWDGKFPKLEYSFWNGEWEVVED